MYGLIYEKPNEYLLSLKEGDTLTSDGDVVTMGGDLLFEKGEKCIINEILKTPSRYSSTFNLQYAEKVDGFKIEGKYGIWFLNTFTETKEFK